MFLKEHTFNHEADDVNQALNLPEYILENCREKIFFATIANALQQQELYGDDDEQAPKELMTMSGALMRTLQMIDDPVEYAVTLFCFKDDYNTIKHAYAASLFINQESKGINKAKIDILIKLKEVSMMEEYLKKGKQSKALSLNGLLKRIELVKAVEYNWKNYIKQLRNNNFYYIDIEENSEKSIDFDVDDLLNNLSDD